jgi:hypothetical protein
VVVEAVEEAKILVVVVAAGAAVPGRESPGSTGRTTVVSRGVR